MAVTYTKAYFERLDAQGRVVKRLEVQFNPTELTTQKGAQIAEINIPGIDNPILQFVRGQNERVTLELFFDTTENGTGAGATPVTTRTNDFYALVKMSGKEHAPPRCRFGWGDEFPGLVNNLGEVTAKRKAFDCIVESIQQKFTLFSPDGVPLRATLSVTLREYVTLQKQLEQLNLQSSDHTRVHVVQRGETLPYIAYTAYKNPALWRVIADANGLLNPRRLEPGTVLRLPPQRV
jgi:nucleoid-associated protein YgaU